MLNCFTGKTLEKSNFSLKAEHVSPTAKNHMFFFIEGLFFQAYSPLDLHKILDTYMKSQLCINAVEKTINEF